MIYKHLVRKDCDKMDGTLIQIFFIAQINYQAVQLLSLFLFLFINLNSLHSCSFFFFFGLSISLHLEMLVRIHL